ncbi:MAG: formylglycine-generating enzyme family protein [Candidatus Delongbacteria bacterium]|jgi:formylglycine-generating enzyme required for sulfatase activity|nr:formylglycine-generating enzyme family protein [Candidatus Delongbacteria bacterium]
MPKLTDEQLTALKELPYWDKLKDIVNLYEVGILSQDKFNDEILKARGKYKPEPISLGIDMVFVEGGTFQMGDEIGDLPNGSRPVHKVTVSDFYIGKTVVTQAQYKEVMGTNPSYFKGDNLPVEQVSWYDAVEFCKKLSKMKGVTYRLPTEAEWEYAARGGNKSRGYKYSGSNDVDDVAWYFGNKLGSLGSTNPVGSKQPNELGIFDMSGNLLELCWDWYGSYTSDAQTDPTGLTSGTYRVLRGGFWLTGASFCRVANRSTLIPSYGFYYFGFRVARTHIVD